MLQFLNFLIWALLCVVVLWPVCAWAARTPAPLRHFHLRAFKPGEMIFTPPDVVLHDHIKAKMRGPREPFTFADLEATPIFPVEEPPPWPHQTAKIDADAIYGRWNDTTGKTRNSSNRRCRYVNCNAFRFPCADCAVIRGQGETKP